MFRNICLLGVLGLASVAAPAPAGLFDHLFGCNDCNQCTTVIRMRPYNAFSPVCCGTMVCDGCCPFPPFSMGGGGGHGHGGGHFGHGGGCPPASWSPCCPTPSFGGPMVSMLGCPDPACAPACPCLPPASCYPCTSYYPPPPNPKAPQGHPSHQGAHTSRYQPYYYPQAYSPQAYSGYGYYWPVSYMPYPSYPGYYYGQPVAR